MSISGRESPNGTSQCHWGENFTMMEVIVNHEIKVFMIAKTCLQRMHLFVGHGHQKHELCLFKLVFLLQSSNGYFSNCQVSGVSPGNCTTLISPGGEV